MNSMLATEAPEKPATRSLQETWGKNERMRHIPSAEWMGWKLDVDIRRRVDKLLAPFASLPQDDPRCGPLEAEFRGFCRALERFTDAVRHGRGGHAPQELPNRISWSIGQAVARTQVTSVRMEESALTITEYFREVWIEPGFLAKRPLQ